MEAGAVLSDLVHRPPAAVLAALAAVAVVAQGGGMGTHGALQGCGGPADRVLLCINVSV
ncbi:hypothetical protein GCM10023162_06720 [Klenkia terrae]